MNVALPAFPEQALPGQPPERGQADASTDTRMEASTTSPRRPVVPTATLTESTARRVEGQVFQRPQPLPASFSSNAYESQRNSQQVKIPEFKVPLTAQNAADQREVPTYKTEFKVTLNPEPARVAPWNPQLTQAPAFSESKTQTDCEPKTHLQLKHGEFSAMGSRQRYLWVPRGVDLRAQSNELIEQALLQWNLEPPSMLMHFKSGFAHPKHMISLEVVRNLSGDLAANRTLLQQLKLFWESKNPDAESFDEALRQLQAEPQTDQRLERLWEGPVRGVSHLLQSDLSELLESILATAVAANCWILVHGGPDGGMTLLEAAAATLSPSPVILVVDSPNAQRYRDLEFYRRAEAWDDQVEATLREALEEGQRMAEELRRQACPLGVAPVAPAMLGKSFWEKHAAKDGAWEVQSIRSPGAEKVRWGQWLFRSGTHYILTEDERYGELQLNELAPQGSIVLGGEASTMKHIVRSLKSCQPLIVLGNTGRAAQWFSAIHHEALCHFGEKGSKDASRLLKGQGFGAEGSSAAGLLEVLFQRLRPKDECSEEDLAELALLFQRKAAKLCRLCVILNPLDPSHRFGTRQRCDVATCLGNTTFVSGSEAAEKANMDSVKAAWEFHAQLIKLSAREKLMADLLIWLVAIFLIVTQVAAWLAHIARQEAAWRQLQSSFGVFEGAIRGFAESGSSWQNTLHLMDQMSALMASPQTSDALVTLDVGMPIALPVVAAITAVLLGFALKSRFALRWGKVTGATVRLEAEISRFRVRTGDYRLSSSWPLRTSERSQGVAPFSSRLSRELQSRMLFDQRVEAIIQEVSQVVSFPKSPNLQKKALTWRESLQVVPLAEVEDVEEAAFAAQKCLAISVDEYVTHRLLPFLEELEAEVVWLGRRALLVEMLSLAFLIASTLCAAFSFAYLASILMVVGLALILLHRHYALQPRLCAANAAVEELKCCWQHWSSLEPFPRQLETTKARLVECTENAKMRLINAATACDAASLKTTSSVWIDCDFAARF